MTTTFTPVEGLVGGILIGSAACLLMLWNGRIAGISGILGGLLSPSPEGAGWRIAFLAGLLLGPLVYAAGTGSLPAVTIAASPAVLVVGGLLVGFGTRLGSGCTSGHGVCGIGRFSKRSIVATAVFMVVAAATVFVVRHVLGGVS